MVLGLISLFMTLFAAASPQEEIAQIDKQIESLQNLQDSLRSSAQRNANNAMRWQFQKENYMDARRAWDQVASDKQKIQELQDQIDDLEARKQKLQEKIK